MSMNCKKCGYPLADEKRECQACSEDNGFPNVRLASRPDELAALQKRYDVAEESSKARSYQPVLNDFGLAVLNSKTVIARSYGFLDDVLEDGNRTWTSWARQLAGGQRVAEANEWDKARASFEPALFPNFHSDILFGCLSLNGTGLFAFGQCAVILKTDLIAVRTTVFEENPAIFCKRLRLVTGDPVPPGYRATWENRHHLAIAKLYPELTSTTKPSDYPAILLQNGRTTGDADYVEAHIFGPINRYTIESVIAKKPKAGHDTAILRAIGRKLATLGAKLEVI
jgi:hypothetical protein